MAVKLTSKDPGAAIVTLPFAVQLRVPAAIAAKGGPVAIVQMIDPVMPVGFETPAAP